MTLAATLRKLAPLLRADDPALAAQGVELAVAFEDPALIDALLDRTSVES